MDMDNLINNGMVILNKNKVSEGKPTVIVLGVARSGTTMIVGVLQELGVYMGGKNMSVVKEDMEVFNLLKNKDRMDEFIQLVKKRDQEHNIWGWKKPRTIEYVDRFIYEVRNPHLIFMFRDSLAIALRNEIAAKVNVLTNLKATQKRYSRLIDFVSKTELPCMLVSYEKAIQKRSFFVRSVADFIGIQPSKEQLRTAENAIALDKKEYIEIAKSSFYKGILGNVKDGIIRGWVKKEGESNPVSIDIIVNNKVVTTVNADQYRKGLEEKGIGHGKHGFSFDLTAILTEEKQYTIQAKVSGTQHELKKSPVEIDIKKKPGEMNKKEGTQVNKQISKIVLINRSKKIMMGWSIRNRTISAHNLINRNKKIIMGFSPKAGCTLANKMFFESADCLEEALSMDPWIHKYRPVYSSQNPVTLRDMQRADLYKFKIVRNPFIRVVSSYAHAMFFKYAEDDIKSVLKTDVSNNITFLQFLDYLEKIDLTRTNPHHGLQKSVKFGEGTDYKYDYICKLEFLEEGIKEINENSAAEFKLEKNILDSRHHVIKIMSFNDSAYDKPFNEIVFKEKRRRKLPDFKFFYNKEIIERVSELYKEDIAEYGYSYDLED